MIARIISCCIASRDLVRVRDSRITYSIARRDLPHNNATRDRIIITPDANYNGGASLLNTVIAFGDTRVNSTRTIAVA